jgi:ABC-type uncharacterized transport system substrate-binding protein
MLKIKNKATLPIICTLFFALAALHLWTSSCHAHPHVFIQSKLEVEMDDKGIRGVWHHWSFDEYFSAWIIDEYDTDGDGHLSPEETSRLYEEAFKNLESYGFWTRVLNGEKEIIVDSLEDFSVEIRDHIATYTFFLPLNIPVSSPSEIFIAVFDEDFYCQIFFPPSEVQFKGDTSAWTIDYTNKKMPEMTYYFGFITPVAVKLSITPS